MHALSRNIRFLSFLLRNRRCCVDSLARNLYSAMGVRKFYRYYIYGLLRMVHFRIASNRHLNARILVELFGLRDYFRK